MRLRTTQEKFQEHQGLLAEARNLVEQRNRDELRSLEQLNREELRKFIARHNRNIRRREQREAAQEQRS